MNTSQELLIYARSTHWVKYIQKTLVYLLIACFGLALMPIALQLFSKAPVLASAVYFIGFTLFLLCHHLLFHLYFSEQMIDIIVTNQRIIYFDDYLFTCDDEHEIPLHKIAAVEVQQHGIIQNMLNYGILWFDTGGGSTDMKRSIPHVPQPDELAKVIHAQLQ
ncbi:MAG: PH domain-containing protein [Candidatus Peregrinibacteria bacterium]|nr:PH domain-containing protein [Candidatus Peregrinibacteria bacterium]MCB9807652.1 PH domain-containing protein [Candidatus Peribacteria bacterium]